MQLPNSVLFIPVFITNALSDCSMQKIVFILVAVIGIALLLTAAIIKENKIGKTECFVSKSDKKTEYIFFLPPNKIIYHKEVYGRYDNGLFKSYGEEAFNIGPIYQVYPSVALAIFGIRYYPNADKVVRYDLKLIKTQGSFPETTFGAIGTSYKSRFTFYPNRVEVGEGVYRKMNNQETKEKISLVMKQLQTDSLVSNYL